MYRLARRPHPSQLESAGFINHFESRGEGGKTRGKIGGWGESVCVHKRALYSTPCPPTPTKKLSRGGGKYRRGYVGGYVVGTYPVGGEGGEIGKRRSVQRVTRDTLSSTGPQGFS